MKRLAQSVRIIIVVLFFVIQSLIPYDVFADEAQKSLLILDLPKDVQITQIESYFEGKGEERACWFDVTIKNLSEAPRIFTAELLLNDTHSFANKTTKPLESNKETKLRFASYLLQTPAEKIYLKLSSFAP